MKVPKWAEDLLWPHLSRERKRQMNPYRLGHQEGYNSAFQGWMQGRTPEWMEPSMIVPPYARGFENGYNQVYFLYHSMLNGDYIEDV